MTKATILTSLGAGLLIAACGGGPSDPSASLSQGVRSDAAPGTHSPGKGHGHACKPTTPGTPSPCAKGDDGGGDDDADDQGDDQGDDDGGDQGDQGDDGGDQGQGKGAAKHDH